jgi:tRNA-splicing endonuclease subunit Sen2
MFSFFRSAPADARPSAKSRGTKRAARNAKLRAQYSDPLPFPAPSPPFNIFSPSTYKSLISGPTPPRPYVGEWCPATRSVNVSNDAEGVEIWQRGMWGKGTLSRSSPAWRQRKSKEMTGGKKLSLEELTALKRKERAEFKEERLKKERLERERILRAEQAGEQLPAEDKEDDDKEDEPKRKRRKMIAQTTEGLPVYTESYLDKETLQLAPEEALFLFHLNLLTITYNDHPLSLSQFLHLIASSSRPDDPFLVYYIVYYHYRRQRLIVKPGLKFAVDFLLYEGPILFTHAAHCVSVIGNYHLWDPEDKLVRDKISWQEINLWQRLMGNVRKRLKLVYVEIPSPDEGGDWRDVESREEFEKVLLKYRIREVTNSRMVIARERDAKPDTK